MTGELVSRDQPTPLVYTQPTAIETWASDLSLAYTAAQKLVRTSFVPAVFKNKPEEAAAAIMTGAEVGLTPLASLRSIVVIQGTPAFTAVALRGLAQAHGHSVWLVESTKTRAIVQGRRSGSDEVQESTWTIDRARDLGLLGKSNWKQQPIAMLIARATSEVARLVAADVLLGVPYSAEELEDGLAEVGVDSPVKTVRKTVKRKPLPASVEPDLPDASEDQKAIGGPSAPAEEPAFEPDVEADYEAESAAEFDAWQEAQQAMERGGEAP